MSPLQSTFTAVCSEGERRSVSADFVEFSNLMPNGLFGVEEDILPLPEITRTVLDSVLAWYQCHKGSARKSFCSSISSVAYDGKYFDNIPHTQVFGLIHASNYLGIDVLLTASCKAVARSLMRFRTSPSAGSRAVRDYLKLTTTTTDTEPLLGISGLDEAVYRVCLIPELRNEISLEHSKLENQSLRQELTRLRGRTEWYRPMGQDDPSSIFDVVNTPLMGTRRGGLKAQALLEQENLCLAGELQRLRLGMRLEIQNAFKRFANR